MSETTTAATLVDRIAADIAARRLKPGDRLPPQRTFAYERGIATSTASRVYAELLRRGLVVGEVGRGTFVATPGLSAPAKPEPPDGRIDLEFNFPTVPGQSALIGKALAALHRPETLDLAFGIVTQRTLAAAREVTAAYLAMPGWQPKSDGFVFTGSGRQSVAAAISSVVTPGGRLAVEALTYPLVRSIAGRLGVALVPVAVDQHGPIPGALAKAHRAAPFQAFYVQPVLHNPLGHTMPPERRREIAAIAAKLDITLIDDRVFSFLADVPSIAALAPERTIVVDSLSKRISPGVGLGILHAPTALHDRLAASVRAGAWSVAPLALQLGVRLMADGTAAELTAMKRADAPKRHAIVVRGLAGASFHTSPQSYIVWLDVPDGWRAEAFAAAAARIGIAVTPAAAFTTSPGHAPNAVRLALGLPPHDVLATAMSRLARLLASSPEDAEATE